MLVLNQLYSKTKDLKEQLMQICGVWGQTDPSGAILPEHKSSNTFHLVL